MIIKCDSVYKISALQLSRLSLNAFCKFNSGSIAKGRKDASTQTTGKERFCASMKRLKFKEIIQLV